MKQYLLVSLSYFLVKFILSSESIKYITDIILRLERTDLHDDDKRSHLVSELKKVGSIIHQDLKTLPDALLNLVVEILVNYLKQTGILHKAVISDSER